MQEKRRYVRLNIPLEVSYTIEGKEATPRKSITKNISPNGVRFTVEGELSAGTVLNVDIKIPTKNEPIPIKAKIIWSKKESEQQGKEIYDAGFEFIQIPEQSKQEFFQYLCNLMYNQLKNFE